MNSLSLLIPKIGKFWNLSRLIGRHRPYINFSLEHKNYKVKTADTLKELYFVFLLRYENFIRAQKGLKKYFSFDIDKFDLTSDHIIIIDKKNNKIVGTYRVRSSLFVDDLYSQSEFNLDNFLNERGVKLELGRACIDHHYRNGTTIDLLWKGLSKYAELTGSRFLCGCSSVKIIESYQALAYIKQLITDSYYALDEPFDICPIGKYDMRLEKSMLPNINLEELNIKYPPLLKSYLKLGAKIHGDPALDFDFKCIDFFTILDINHINETYKKRYFEYLC